MFRSLLFIPGNNPSMIQNADVYLSDAIIFDLEDAVDINEKDNARNLVGNYLENAVRYPKITVIRVNSVDTEYFYKDIDLVKNNNVDYVLLPKSTVDSLNILEEELLKIESEHSLNQVKVIALVESSKSIIEVFKIAKHQRVEAILLGAEDLCNDLEISRTNLGEEILFARSRVIYACASNNIISIDTPNTSYDSEADLREDCQNAKRLGMKAKTAIHPSQLEIINEIFSPSSEEINWATRVFNELDKNEGKSVFSLDGKMIDKPIIMKAEKILDKAKRFKLI